MQPRTLENPAQASPLLCTLDDVRVALGGISERRVYQLLADGSLEKRYLGHRRMISWQSVLDYVQSLPTERDDGD